MRLLMTIIFFLAGSMQLFGGEADIDDVIAVYNKGEYIKAAYVLEGFSEKDAKIYFFLGQSYYKGGDIEKARENFLAAYYLEPDSKWGRAAYKNYKHIFKKALYFAVDLGLMYDSNISYLPDIEYAGSSAFLADAYISAVLYPSEFISMKYSYSRNQYFSGLSSNDSHFLGADIFMGPVEAEAMASYSLVGGLPFYFMYGGGAETEFLEAGIRIKKYINPEYDYLDGYKGTAKLKVDLFGVGLSYEYGYNEARDLQKNFTYLQHSGSVYDSDYDFAEIESDREYFLSQSYQSHEISVKKDIPVNGSVVLSLEGNYAFELYSDENKWYRDYWLKDVIQSKWYYWSDEHNDWIESAEAAPGEIKTALRKDNRAGAAAVLNYIVDKNTQMRFFLEYTINISTMDDVASFNYNWSKIQAGAALTYNF